MDEEAKRSNDNVQPVAYDAEGQPLYAAPPSLEQTEEVTSEAKTPEDSSSSELDTTKEHEKSQRLYPDINLSADEHVLMVIKRHPIGVIIPMSVTIGLILFILVGLFAYPYLVEQTTSVMLPGVVPVTMMALLLIILVGLLGYAAVWVYLKNTMYLTNENLIQIVRLGLFSKQEHTIELTRIEDSSFRQVGILQLALDYGTIRLSTVGDETTYQLRYVINPKQQLAQICGIIENCK